MANTRQSAKRVRQTNKKTLRNRIVKSETKTVVKELMNAITAQKKDQIKDLYRNACKAIDQAVSKNVYPKARASRKISRITKLIQKSFSEKVL